jgi:hypothetical protein
MLSESSEAEKVPRTIARHVFWRRQYRQRRYLQYLTEDELVQRAKDILANQLTLTGGLKIGFYDFESEGDSLLQAFTHVLEELVLRGYVPPAPLAGKIADAQIPKYDWPGLPKAIHHFRNIVLPRDGVLIKYGKTEHLRDMIDVGRIRISSAASYDDPSLNAAIRDTELEISQILLPSEVELEVFDGKTGQRKGTITPAGHITFTAKANTNYYAYCLASRFDLRMFGDFDADACVVIKEPVRFVEAIQAEWDRRMPGWDGVALPVNYIDPFGDAGDDPDVFSSKHFRYGYQREFRCIWLPPTKRDVLDPLFLELGSLREYCELITLGGD